MITCFVSAATFGPVDCLSTRLFLDGPKIAEEFEVNGRLAGNCCAVGAKPGEKSRIGSTNRANATTMHSALMSVYIIIPLACSLNLWNPDVIEGGSDCPQAADS